MRIFLLIVVLASAVTLVFAADDAQRGANGNVAATPAARQFTLSPSPGRTFQLGNPQKLNIAPPGGTVTFGSSGPVRLPEGMLTNLDNTCYRMRTFQVRRVDNTDVTRPAGYTTCLPGRQVQMKSAVHGSK